MTALPRIAVFIPCFNDGKTLPAAVDSALDQEPCEVVVVDDGSTDPETLAVLRTMEPRGVRVVHQENRGPGAARMTALRASSAPYVIPLDADDFLQGRSLTLLADYLDSHADVGVVWGRRKRLVGDKQFVYVVGANLDPWQITYFNDLPTSTMIRRRALVEAGGFALSSGYEDWDVWMSLAERGVRGKGLEHEVFCYRVHGPRRFARDISRHSEIYALLRARHPALFAARAQNRKRSTAPRVVKALLPVTGVLWPLTGYQRMWLAAQIWRAGTGRLDLRGTYRRRADWVGRLLARLVPARASAVSPSTVEGRRQVVLRREPASGGVDAER